MLKKKSHITISVIIIICLAAFSNWTNAADKVRIITCECPPLSYKVNNRAEGPGVDIVRNIQKKLNIDEKINVWPWARGYLTVRQKPNTVLFSTARTPQRENLFKWVGPMAEKKYVFHAKKGSKIKINNLEDAKKYKIGVHRSSNNEQFLVSNGFKILSSVTIEKQNLLKLNSDRIDLWYTDSATSSILMARNSLEGSVEELYVVQKAQLYYAFNINTSDRIVNKWQEALDALRQEGTILDIFKNYKMEALYPFLKTSY